MSELRLWREPDFRGVEWLNYSERAETRAMPLPRCLANLKRDGGVRAVGRYGAGAAVEERL